MKTYRTLERNRQILHKAISYYGSKNQLLMLTEECGELIVAVNHLLRQRKGAMSNLIEELADVSIMIQQIIEYHRIDYAVHSQVLGKINRLKERLSTAQKESEQ